MADLAFVDRLQKMHAKQVGWMPTKQLEGKIAAGQVLVAEEGESEAVGREAVKQSDLKCVTASPLHCVTPQPLGYCIGHDQYFKRDDCGIIYQMNVVPAETGKAAIDLLQEMPDIDAVLMDIMMPGMDGYDTMRAIRKMKAFRHLPIIAVTAKAMKGDREKTIEAGAWDYLSKPVDSNQMLAVMRAWLRR